MNTIKTRLAYFVFACLCTSMLSLIASADITAPGAKLEKLAGGFSFTEGPAADKDGNVYFTDQPNDRILVWSTDGKLSTYMQPSGRSNGLFFDREGNLFSCADEKNELWKIDKDKNVTVLVKKYQDKYLNGPNDLWIHPNGGIFFSDPFYKRSYWKLRDGIEQDVQAVYYLSPDGKTLKRVEDTLQQPNGIIGTPDGKTLFVADIRAGKTYRYEVKDGNSLANRQLFCEQGSDGMTLDAEGNLYLTGRDGVSVFDPTGKKIQTIGTPESWTANVCFGGKDHTTLFITARESLYAIKTTVKGAY